MSKEIIKLESGWKIKYLEHMEEDFSFTEDFKVDSKWINAEVPGDVHIDLYNSALISDPYYSENGKEIAWVTEKDWLYHTTFRLPKNFQKEQTRLIFSGIDTYSTIWLNGNKLGNTENMFKEYWFDVSEFVKPDEENTLIVEVKSIKSMMAKNQCDKYFACYNAQRIFVRKAQYQFGWDWAPDMTATGIWQDVKLISISGGYIQDIFVCTKINGEVTFQINLDKAFPFKDLSPYHIFVEGAEVKYELLLTVIGSGVPKKKIPVLGFMNTLALQIDKPKLWWPNGYGEAHLYEYEVVLLKEGVEIDKKCGRLGIREIELVQESRPDNSFSFRFDINKTPVYCKGANWVPTECFTGTVRDEKYRNLIMMAREANMNMLRVWGGGIYEKDLFYELCDENGIMVWQDLMFACSDIPDDDSKFVDMVITELEYQVRRLRVHPSIVYWCGSNEKTGIFGEMMFYGKKVFNYIGRGICGDLDGTRPYGPTSPISFSDIANHQNSGDTHCNCLEASVNHGMEKYRDEIEKITAVYNSEIAILGPARYQSMEKFIPEDKLWPLNQTWEYHMRENPYSGVKKTYLQWEQIIAEGLFGGYNDVKEFLKKAMAGQAEILRSEIEHHRTRKWQNCGAMFWMFSDVWTTGTWSVIDYFELPKPSYYSIKRAFEPVLLSMKQKDGNVVLFAVNDTLEAIEGFIEYGQATVDGDVLWENTIEHVNISANKALEVLKMKEFIKDKPNSYLFARMHSNKVNYETTFFHDQWKNIQWQEPELEFTLLKENFNNGYYTKIIEITSKKFARMININLEDRQYAYFNDNFFDLEAGGKKQIEIRSKDNFYADKLRLDHWLTEWE